MDHPLVIKRLINRIIIYTNRLIAGNETRKIIVLSVLTGILSGVLAVLVKRSTIAVHWLVNLFNTIDWGNYFYFVSPLLGISITVLIAHRLLKKKVSHGIPSTIYAIIRKKSRLPFHATYSSMITSLFTVGFGGSVGLEGPSVSTGSAIGSVVGRFFNQNYKTTTVLLAAGAAGAISGIFSAPVGAMIFVLEIFMFDFSASFLLPVLLSSSMAALTSMFIYGKDAIFKFSVQSFAMKNIPLYIILGILCGMYSVYFVDVVKKVEKFSNKRKTRPWKRIIVYGIPLGWMIFFIPPLYGEGYEVITRIAGGDIKALVEHSIFYHQWNNGLLMLVLIAGILFFKPWATSLTFAAGGVGGIFAPSFFAGGILGFFLLYILQQFAEWDQMAFANFTLAGMAGVMAGVMHTPLTAVFLVAELANGYNIFIPLMLTVALSYATSRYFNPESIYQWQMKNEGLNVAGVKESIISFSHHAKDILEKDFVPVYEDETLGSMIEKIKISRRNTFPVIDRENNFKGVLTIDQLKDYLFDRTKYDMPVKQLVQKPDTLIYPGNTLDYVSKQFQATKQWNLPVVSKNGKYLGFVSRFKVMEKIKETLLRENGF